MGQSPIWLAIEKIIHLFDFHERVFLYNNEDSGQKYSSSNVLCVLDEFGCSFLESVSLSDAINKLPPIFYLSFKNYSSTDGLFKKLSEVSPKKFRYFHTPFDIAAFIGEVNHLLEGGQLYDNPFMKLLDLKQNLSTTCETKPDQFFKDLSEAALVGGRRDNSRLKIFHDIRSETGKLEKFLSCECCLEYIYASLEREKLKEKKKKILWIENRPNDSELIHEIEILKDYFHYTFHIKETSEKINECYNALKRQDSEYDNYDLFIIDIFLGENEDLSGKDFLKILAHKYPHVPAFILSGSEDLELISNTVKEGADFYILKKYARSIPYYLRRFYESIGDVMLLIKDKNLRKNLIGNIRTWRFNKEILWFGDKCYHMINHGYNHAENDWKLLNQFFPSVYKVMTPTPSDEDIYCLSMAVWLHDIGHAGNERYGEPHDVRDNHSAISGDFILKHPEHYGIFGYDKFNHSPYKNKSFSFDSNLTALQSIKGEIAKGNYGLLEKIALMSIYHSSKFPIDEEDVDRIKAKKDLSLECYEDRNNNKKPIHLASLATLAKDGVILKLTSILRIIDALDHNKNRVGDNRFRSIKIETNWRDVRHQLSKLQDEVNSLAIEAKLKKGVAKEFCSLFYEQVKDKIDKKVSLSELKQQQKNFIKHHQLTIDTRNYNLLLEYIKFLCVQEGHFDLHNAIEDINIRVKDNFSGKLLLDIRFITSKNIEDLKKIEVKNWDDEKGEILPNYLLGKRGIDCKLLKENGKFIDAGYIGKEFGASEEYIKEFIDIENHMAGIYDLDGNLLFPEKT